MDYAFTILYIYRCLVFYTMLGLSVKHTIFFPFNFSLLCLTDIFSGWVWMLHLVQRNPFRAHACNANILQWIWTFMFQQNLFYFYGGMFCNIAVMVCVWSPFPFVWDLSGTYQSDFDCWNTGTQPDKGRLSAIDLHVTPGQRPQPFHSHSLSSLQTSQHDT